MTVEAPSIQTPSWREPEVLTLSTNLRGIAWDIEVLHWPGNTRDAIILVHGHSGVKENYFHTLPDKNATFGARLAATGRTVVALDLPGYGGTDGDPDLVNFEIMEQAVRRVAAMLRAGDHPFQGHAGVSAYGLSMGAIIVTMAGVGDDLDAIIPAGFPQTPMTEAGLACGNDPACPAAREVFNDDFYVPNIDWDVANATIAGYESGMHDANYPGYAAWVGPCAGNTEGLPLPCPAQQPGHAFAQQITIPVFVWVGDHDIPWLGTDLSGEAGYYPEADVDTWVVPDAGHFIHNHLHQPMLVERLDAWLAGHGL